MKYSELMQVQARCDALIRLARSGAEVEVCGALVEYHELFSAAAWRGHLRERQDEERVNDG
jgi:hypothetical protein